MEKDEWIQFVKSHGNLDHVHTDESVHQNHAIPHDCHSGIDAIKFFEIEAEEEVRDNWHRQSEEDGLNNVLNDDIFSFQGQCFVGSSTCIEDKMETWVAYAEAKTRQDKLL